MEPHLGKNGVKTQARGTQLLCEEVGSDLRCHFFFPTTVKTDFFNYDCTVITMFNQFKILLRYQNTLRFHVSGHQNTTLRF